MMLAFLKYSGLLDVIGVAENLGCETKNSKCHNVLLTIIK